MSGIRYEAWVPQPLFGGPFQRARYSTAITTPAAASGAAYAELLRNAQTGIALCSVGIVTNAATATSIGLTYSATKGIATTSTKGALLGISDGEPSIAAVATTWSVAPTVSSPLYYRRVTLPATAGSSVTWLFESPVPISANLGVGGQSLLLWNFGGGAGSACEIYMEWIELDGM